MTYRYDGEPDSLYPADRPVSDGEARLWQALEDYRRHVNNLEQRINGQQTEIDQLKTTLDRMTGPGKTDTIRQVSRPAQIQQTAKPGPAKGEEARPNEWKPFTP